MTTTLHHTRLMRGEVVASTYPFEEAGQLKWTATCSCGWNTSRTLRDAAETQLDRHTQANP